MSGLPTTERARLLAEAGRLQARIAARGVPVPPASTRSLPTTRPAAARPALSVMFFSAEAGDGGRSPYDLVLRAARIADRAGFEAAWLPERHFEAFGGPYPNPAVLAAALASGTERIRIRAGSVILPLHDTVEVVEAWAMVDQLSGGRVDLAFGSGWNPADFALRPANFADNRSEMRRQVEEFRVLWAGGAATRTDGRGEAVAVRPHPRPRQAMPGLWAAATGNPETFEWAGGAGLNVLTMVLGGSLEQVAERIAVYRAARSAAGLDPAAGRVTLMLHTYLDPDRERLLARVRGPMTDYVRKALDLHAKATAEDGLGAGQRDRMADFAFQRYLQAASLIGTPDDCAAMLERVAGIGVDEVACLLDFGLAEEHAIEGLERLTAWAGVDAGPAESSAAMPRPDAALAARRAAVVGLACRLPGAADHDALVALLRSGGCALDGPPAGRWPVAAPALASGGFIGDVECFDPGPFRIAHAEAAVMDPHQRLFLEAVWHALEDAGLRPTDLRGARVGVFAAFYSTSFLERRRPGGDPLSVPGGIGSMVANRTSFVFDWRGPSETIDTACSSGLVAVHRALRALRDDECDLAVVGGVSLLLSDAESARLSELGILAADGRCRAFDAAAGGQARGEGVAVLVLRRLDRARAAGDRIRAVVAGSAVCHAGGSAGSLTLPSTTAQTRAVVEAWRDAGAVPRGAGYIEAHGAGTLHGDRSEVAAFRAAFRTLGAKQPDAGQPDAGQPDAEQLDWTIGSVKPAIGSLDACGGIAGMLAAVAAVEQGFRPPLAGFATAAPDLDLEGSGLRLARAAEPWAAEVRRVGVHAYGLGGVGAHVVLEAPPAAATGGETAGGVAVFPLGAWDAAALDRQRLRLAAWIDANPEAAPAAVAATLALGREPMPSRLVAVARRLDELAGLLRSPAATAGALLRAAGVAADDPVLARARSILGGADPAAGAARVPLARLPGYAFAPTRFPIDAQPDSAEPPQAADAVARFYDYVAAAGAGRAEPPYLTLAPFPEVVPGFSWTRTMQDPDRHPEHHELLRAAQVEMRRVLLADVPFERLSRVLDFGCGFAADLIALGRAHRHLQGVGFTIAPAQAEAARRNVATAGLDARIAIRCADSAVEPFPGGFDLAIGYEVGHHIANKDGLFGNLARAIVPGGRLALIDCAADTAQPILLPEVGSWTSTLAGYAEILARHGFRLVRVVDASREVGNFLVDPGLDAMLADETGVGAEHVARVQRSWDGFGAALREGLLRYLLMVAERLEEGASSPLAWNRSRMGIAP